MSRQLAFPAHAREQGIPFSPMPNSTSNISIEIKDKRARYMAHEDHRPGVLCDLWLPQTGTWVSLHLLDGDLDNTVSLDSNLFLSKMKQNRINLIYLKPTMAHLVAESQCLDSISRTKGNTSFI